MKICVCVCACVHTLQVYVLQVYGSLNFYKLIAPTEQALRSRKRTWPGPQKPSLYPFVPSHLIPQITFVKTTYFENYMKLAFRLRREIDIEQNIETRSEQDGDQEHLERSELESWIYHCSAVCLVEKDLLFKP